MNNEVDVSMAHPLFLLLLRKRIVMELVKFERQLRLMMMLTQNRSHTLEDLGKMLGMSPRSVYRYLEAFKMAGFVVRKTDKCYYLDKSSPYFKDITSLVHFTEEEAYVLKRAIESLDGGSAMKQNLKKKLYNLYAESDNDLLLDTINENNKKLTDVEQQIIAEEDKQMELREKLDISDNLDSLENIWNFLDGRQKQAIIRSVVDKIVITDDVVEINYNL